MEQLPQPMMAPQVSDQPIGLPPESLDRLTALVRNALGENATAPDESLRAWVTSLAPGPLLPAPVLVEDISKGAPSVSVSLPKSTRALALISVKDFSGLALEDDRGQGGEVVLCVASTLPRQWSARDLGTLDALAATVATELQLRAGLARHERMTEELRKYPLHDPVTELANRELFLDRVGQALLRNARNPQRHMAVMSLELNQSQDIENTLGYDAVRDVLRELGKRLRIAVRNVDSTARLSGDEFGVLLEALRDNHDAARVAARIHESLRAPISTMWGEFMVSANIGIVLSETGLDSPARLVQLAGLARDRARTTGSNYEIFDRDMQQRAQTRLNNEMELRRAVEADEFELYYQPIISLSTGRIADVEALIRWHHPKRGITVASDFIPLAEETGLVVPLGWTVLAKGCRQLREWLGPKKSKLAISINLTAVHLTHPELYDRVRRALEAHGLSEGSLNVEITEGILIGNPGKAKDILTQLRGLGVGVHLDDFGTGYSSLHYLHELPLDAIKIDRRFIARLENEGSDSHVVGTIRQLARGIGVPVIAEGVETPKQLERVRELGCEYAQGYLFSRPLPQGEMSALMKENPVW